MDRPKYNLFFTSPIIIKISDIVINRVRRSIWLVNLLATMITLAGILFTIYGSSRLAGSRQIAGVVLGFLMVFTGSHILWAGLASLRGVEKRLEGVEEG